MSCVLDNTSPFSRAEARAAGLTDRTLAGPRYRKVFTGVYVSSAIPDTLVVRTKAALKVAPGDAVVSHHTAARLWGGAVPDSPNVHLAFARDVGTTVAGVKTHRFNRPMAVHRRHGLLVTTPEQTLLHLARPLDLVELVACADQFVRRNVTTSFDLAEFARQYGGQGGQLAEQAGLLSRSRVDSAAETRVRLLMVLSGLPEPSVNHPITRPDGTVEYRLDLSYPDFLLAIEYDGRWHDTPEQRALDEARRTDLATRGWTFIVLHAEDLYETPDQTVASLYAKLRQRGIPVPPLVDEGWRRHFPVRALTTSGLPAVNLVPFG
jgi:hypothetical protein